MKYRWKCRFLLAVLVVMFLQLQNASAQRYEVGDVVDNFTLIDRSSGQEVSLHDLEGYVIFLEWFAWWCPFCQAAAAEIEPGIVEYYKNLRGTGTGAPFIHVALNLQGGQDQQTQGFIAAYNLGLVLEDTSRVVARQFQSSGQPIFAIINGVANSPSHQQWELVYSQLGYGQLSFPIETFRTAIDSIQAAPQETGFEAYLSQLGIPENLRGLADDPDRDGVPNGIEYLTGTIASDSSSARAPTFRFMSIGGSFYLAIEYVRDTSVNDYALIPQFGSGLDFANTSGFEEVSVELIGDGIERVVARSIVSLQDNHQFGRLAVSPASAL